MTEYALRISEAEVQRYRLMAERALARESAAWADAGFVEGASIADVGCGPGIILSELARIVGPRGAAVGVERDRESAMIAESVLAASGATNARLVIAEATDTGIEPGSLDAVMVRHVLIHNDSIGIARILGHIRDLLRVGGHAYVIDSDLTAHRQLPVDPVRDEEGERYCELLKRRGCDPAIGARVGDLLREAGFEIALRDAWWELLSPMPRDATGPAFAARAAMIEAGLATSEDCERWDAARARLLDNPSAARFIPVFRGVGRKAA